MARTSRTHGSFAALALAALTLPGIACTPVEFHDEATPGSSSSSGATSGSGSGTTSSSGASPGGKDGSKTRDIHTFLACLNTIDSTRVSDAVTCLPSGCYYTVTTSTVSGQPGCTLTDGTKLPRVDISCPGPSSSLRFRPSFTLCTNAGIINHIEMGEEANAGNRAQKFADIDSTLGFQTLTEFGPSNPIVYTSTANKRCGECHFKKGSVTEGGRTIPLWEDIPPDREVLFSNDPNDGPGVNLTPLSEVCAGIQASTQLATDPALQKLAVDLCNALVLKLR